MPDRRGPACRSDPIGAAKHDETSRSGRPAHTRRVRPGKSVHVEPHVATDARKPLHRRACHLTDLVHQEAPLHIPGVYDHDNRRLRADRDHTHPFVVPTLGVAVRDEANSQNVRTCRE